MKLLPNLISLLFYLCLLCCFQKGSDLINSREQSPRVTNSGLTTKPGFIINTLGDTVPTGVPITIKGKDILPKDEIQPPLAQPFGQPEIFPVHQNSFEALPSKRVNTSNNISVTVLGQNGLPNSDTNRVHIKGSVQLISQPKRFAAGPLQMKDKARNDIRYLDAKGSLPANGIMTMMMDGKGDMLFGSSGGVSRYDGQFITYYTYQTGLTKNLTLSLHENEQGHLWIGTMENGISYYDGKHVIQFTKKEGFPFGHIRQTWEDKYQNLWILCDGHRGRRFTGGLQLVMFRPDTNNKIGELKGTFYKFPLKYSTGQSLLVSRSGSVWVGHTKGLSQFVLTKNGTIEKIIHYNEDSGLGTSRIGPLTEDKAGNIWAGAFGKLIRFEPDASGINGTFTHFPITESLKDDAAEYIKLANDGTIWFTTFEHGVYRFELPQNKGSNGQYSNFTVEDGLTVDKVLSIVEDTNGKIWFGSANGGICRLDLNSFVNVGIEAGLLETPIHTILEDHQQDIWLGTGMWRLEGKGLFRYQDTIFSKYTMHNGLTSNSIRTMIEDSNKNIWLGAFEGLQLLSPNRNTIYRIDPSISAGCWHLFQDSRGNIWPSCSLGVGLFKNGKNFKEDTFFHFSDQEGLSSDVLFNVLQDNCNNHWFTGHKGVGRFRLKRTGKEAIFNFFTDEANSNPYVRTGIEDYKGRIWFGIGGHGISVYQPNGCDSIGIFTSFTVTDGLIDNDVWSIKEDNQHRIWAATSQGLCLFVPKTEVTLNKPNSVFEEYQLFTFDGQDGLKEVAFLGSSVLLDSKNRLWWGRTKGISRLDLNTFQLPSKAPKNLQLSQIDIKGHYIDYRRLKQQSYKNQFAFGEVLTDKIDSIIPFKNHPLTLELPYDLNHLTFHFAAKDWAAPHQLKYSYYLEGLEKDWSVPTKAAKADYRNLPYGNFTLKVKAIGAAQKWSAPFDYHFTILPPWWHTWWARVLFSTLCLATLFYIRHVELQKQYKKLEREKAFNRQLQTINEANEKFVPKDFLEVLGKTSITQLQLGDQTAIKMTILFVDIRDYTTMSETMTPDENFNFINAFLGRMGPIIKRNGGFICQYFGDGLMALFKEKHEKAIKTAIEMQRIIATYNQKRKEQNRPHIQAGIGLNTGQLMLGVIGDKNRFDSSVISDAVNTASRMEGLTKIFGCSVIVSEKTLQELALRGNLEQGKEEKLQVDRKSIGNTTYTYRFLGKVKVKGKDKALTIYDFYDGDPINILQLKTQTKNDFEKALHFYFDKDFGKAADLLKIVLEQYPEDKAAKYYFDKALQFVINGVEENWSGVEKMVSK